MKITAPTKPIFPITLDDINNVAYKQPHKKTQLAILIVTFLRDKLLFNLVNSIFKHIPMAKIYIADQGLFSKAKNIFYNELIKHGHEVHYSGFDAGLGVSRNLLLKYITEKYIMVLDDDALINSEYTWKKMIDILKHNKKLGVIGNREKIQLSKEIKSYEIDLIIDKNILLYYNAWKNPANIIKNLVYCDAVFNTFIAKKEIFNDIKWDDDLKLCEHIDFFLQLKKYTEFKVACYKNSFCYNQNKKSESGDYSQFRKRNKIYWSYYINKWGVEILDGSNIIDNAKKYNIKNIPEEQPLKNIIDKKIIKPYDLDGKVIIEKLIDNGYKVCLLDETCYLAIMQKSLKDKTLHLGVSNLEEAKKLIKSKNVKLYNLPKKTKKRNIFNLSVLVPYPVITYLYNKGYPNIVEEIERG